jgi:predicted small lipoprotein YifL
MRKLLLLFLLLAALLTLPGCIRDGERELRNAFLRRK